MTRLAFLLLAIQLLAGSGAAQGTVDDLPPSAQAALRAADVVLLGETHDNPTHHITQAAIISALRPSAVVWEMLTEEAAARVDRQVLGDPVKLAEALRWAELGWPPLSIYLPVFQAQPEARIYGALVPREAAYAAIEGGAAVALGADAARFGLNIRLPADEQAAREADQLAAHCDALPAEVLPSMVQIQRLRDAVLTRAILRAIEETGGPVAVITGNGHARKDRGVPVFLARMEPGLRVFALGQSENGAIDGAFDAVLDSPPVARDDPCAAFGQGE